MREQRLDKYAPEWQIWTALGVVYVVWGSTYLAIKVVVQTMPPLLSGGIRHLLAAVIIFALLALTRGSGALRLTRAEWIGAGFVGVALLLGGNGLIMLAQQSVPSGLAALIVAIVPLWVILLRRIFGEQIRGGTIVGVIVGFGGVAVLIVPEGISGDVDIVGMLMIVAAALSWAIGSYLSKRLDLPRDPLPSTGAQMLAGGASLLAVGLVTGEAASLHLEEFSAASLLSLGYLVTFGSVLAYTAYTWSLQHAPVSRVATYAYVNPIVAIVLGAMLLDESVNPTMLMGAAMIIVSVALVIRTESRTSHPTGVLEASPAASEEVLELDERSEAELDGEDVSRQG